MTDARILDRGFQHYDGPRRGLAGAVRSVVWTSAKRALGLRRPARAKVIPILTAVISYLPAVVFVGAAILVPVDFQQETSADDFAGYYGVISLAVVLFVAFVGPEMLCPDRRSGMLGLYLASPLTRNWYLAAKAAAITLVLLIVTIGAPLVLLLGYTIGGLGPESWSDFGVILLRILLAGFVMTLFYACFSLAVAAFTTRIGVAAAAIIIAMFASAAATEALVQQADMSEYLGLLNLSSLPIEVAIRIFGEASTEQEMGALAALPTGAVYGAYAVLTVLSAGIAWLRYQYLDVTK